MIRTLRLVVTTPFDTLVDRPAVSVRAEDASGGFGILPGHTPLLTVLPASIVRWREPDAQERYCALGGGVMTVDAGEVRVTCREGLTGTELDRLEQDVLRMRDKAQDVARQKRVEIVQLEARAMRRIVALLHGAPELADQFMSAEDPL